jgi:hypothetical protein
MRGIAIPRLRSLVRSLATVFALALLAAPGARAEHHEAQAGQAAPAVEPERKPWDQARMQGLAGQLAQAVDEVREAFRREPGYRDPSNPHRRAFQQMDQILKSLRSSTRQLAARLETGGGYEDTLGIARKIGQLLNDAEVEGRKIMTSEWMAQRVVPAKQLLNEIAPYYGRGPLYDPQTLEKVD